MQLRTTAGRYAGEIRDYSHLAGLAALKAGTAVRPDAPPVRPIPPQTEARPAQASAHTHPRRRRS